MGADHPEPLHQRPDDQRDRLMERLRALRDAVRRRSEHLTENFDAVVEATRDVATDDEHDPEGHTIAWERQQLAALAEASAATIAEIELAEQRLQDGSYGWCSSCSAAINPERLAALPVTRFCIDCAR